MSKNITILEGGETRTFGNVEKLQANLIGGGTQNWVPEDEAVDYVDADELSVTENGYYVPDEGKFYNAVDVLVEEEPELEEITITENGTYTPQNAVGFSSVSVEVDTTGEEGDPEVHGNEVTAIAQTDINAGDTVAVQNPSDEPVSIACPMPGIAANSNPSAFDGKFLYWNSGQFYASEVRKKAISNITSENYTVVATKAAGDTSYYNPWLYEYRMQNGFKDSVATWQTIFTNKKCPTGSGANAIYGRYHAIGDGKGMYDTRMNLVNQNVPSWPYGNGGYALSTSRMIYRWGGAAEQAFTDGVHCNSFKVGLIGGAVDTYNITIPSGVNPDANNRISSWGLMFLGTDKCAFIVRDGLDTNKHFICVASFEPQEEYEGTTHEVDPTIIQAFECTDFTIGHDTLYDTWAVASNNGLFVIYSDETVKSYPKLKSTAVPFLAQQYVFLNGSCYKLIDDAAIMIPTNSKGTDGQLGVAKHNVQAGEEGTAIILFS